jgi:hypothetical protein
MKVKVKKKDEKRFFIIDSDYFCASKENSVTILLGPNQYVANGVVNELYFYLECSGCESCLEKEDVTIISPFEYVSVRKFDNGTNYLTITKKDNEFCLEVYVDNELILS